MSTDPTTIPSSVGGAQDAVARRGPSALGWALAASISVLALYVASMWDFIVEFVVYGDDASAVLNSASPYFALSRWGEWFTKGFSEYAVNYPDWGPFGNNTLKPVANLTLFLEGLLAPHLGSPAYLISSYVAPAITAFALVYVFRKLTPASIAVSFLASLCVATSAVWIGSLFAALDIVNTFALMFSVIALVLLPVCDEVPSPSRQALLLLVMVLAIFSHETAIVLPFVCVALIFAFSGRTHSARTLWPYLVAPLVWGIARFGVLQSAAGVYALNPANVPIIKELKYLVPSAVAPLDIQGLWMGLGLSPVRSATLGTELLLTEIVIMAVNGLFLVSVAAGLVARHSRREVLLVVAFGLASVPHFITAAGSVAERFAGLSMVIGLILWLNVARGRWRTAATAALGVLLVAQLFYLATGVMEFKQAYTAEVRGAEAWSAYAREAVLASRPDRVIVVNDRYGFFSVPAMTRVLTWPYDNYEVVVINNLMSADEPTGTVSVDRSGDTLRIAVDSTPDSRVIFLGAERVDFSRPNQGFTYTLRRGTIDKPLAFTAQGRVDDRRSLIIGYDPATRSFLDPVIVE